MEMNVNVAKARTMLGMVSGESYIDSSLLLEDDTFCKLLTEYAHSLTIEDGVARLMNHVNENY